MLMQILVMTVCMYPAAKVVVIIIRRATKHFIQWEESFITYILALVNMEGPNTMYQEQTHFITAGIHTYLCGFRNMLMLCFFLPD